MIHHVWSVFCSSSAIDRDTNQVSLFDLVEQITIEIQQAEVPPPAGQKVIFPARLQVVTLWTRGEPNDIESGLSRLRLVAPTGEELLRSESDVDLREHQLRRVRVNLAGMPYVGDGRYRFLVELRDGDAWRIVGDLPVQIEVKMPAGREPAEPEV